MGNGPQEDDGTAHLPLGVRDLVRVNNGSETSQLFFSSVYLIHPASHFLFVTRSTLVLISGALKINDLIYAADNLNTQPLPAPEFKHRNSK